MSAVSEHWNDIANELSLSLDELMDNKLIESENISNRAEAILQLEKELETKEEIIFYDENLSSRNMKKFKHLKKIKFILTELEWVSYAENKYRFENTYDLEYDVDNLNNLYDQTYLEIKDLKNIKVNNLIQIDANISIELDKETCQLNVCETHIEDCGRRTEVLKKLLSDSFLLGRTKLSSVVAAASNIDKGIVNEIIKNSSISSIHIDNSIVDIKPFLDSKNLYEISYENMKLSSLDIFPVLKNVEMLNVTNNNIQDITDLVRIFPSLERLHASSNQIKRFPKELPENLHDIILSYNQISGVIDKFPQCTEAVNLSHNMIEKIIFENVDYDNEVLNLSHNEITDIENIKHFNSLNRLYIDFNPIINDSDKIKKITSHMEVSILPRVVYGSKDEVIGSFGIIDNADVSNKNNQAISDTIINRLKYNKAMNASYSSSVNSKTNNTKFSFLISGKWGSGKTHYYKTTLKTHLNLEGYELVEYSTYLNNAEDPFNTILTLMDKKIDPFLSNFFKELYKRKWLILILFTTVFLFQLSLDYVIYLKEHSSVISRIISPFGISESILKIMPLTLVISLLSLPLSLLLKNNEYLDQKNMLKKCGSDKKIIVIDDLERVKIEKQIEIINAIQTLKEHVNILVLMDEIEFCNSLSTYYGTEFDYKAYNSKIFDYKFNFSSIALIDYYENNVIVKDDKIDRILNFLLRNKTSLSKLSVRDLKKLLNNLFSNMVLLEAGEELKYINVLKEISTEVKKYIMVEEELALLKIVHVYNAITNDANRQEISKVLHGELSLDFYLVNYLEFNSLIQSQVLDLCINQINFGKINLEEIRYSKKVNSEDVELMINHCIKKGIFSKILSTASGVNNKEELIYYIFERLNYF